MSDAGDSTDSAGFGHTNEHGYFFFAAEDAPDAHPVEYQPQSWAQLVSDLLEFGTNGPYWIFRGHASTAWLLTARLLRDLERSRIPPEDWSFAEQTVTGFFKERALAFIDDPPAGTELLRWLSLMQHYRAPTRLLDWSASPFVAVYFALAEEPVDDYAAVWALNAYYSRRQYVGSLPGFPFDHLGTQAVQTTDAQGNATIEYPVLERSREDDENQLVRWVITSMGTWPLPVMPFFTDRRMAAQRAVFTCAGVDPLRLTPVG